MITIRPFLTSTSISIETGIGMESVFSQLLSLGLYSKSQLHRAFLVEDETGKTFRHGFEQHLVDGKVYHLCIDGKCPFLVVRIDESERPRVYDFLRRDYFDPEEVLEMPLSEYLLPTSLPDSPYQLYFDYFYNNKEEKSDAEMCERLGIRTVLPGMSIYILEEQLRPWLTNLFAYCCDDPDLPEPRKDAIVEWVMANLDMCESKRPILDKALTVLLDCIPGYESIPIRRLFLKLHTLL